MELLDGIETRRSCRAFKSTPVPRETIERILKAARMSPSFQNTQPWEVAVVTGEKKEELSERLLKLAEQGVTPSPDMPTPRGWPPELDKRARDNAAARSRVLGIERLNEQQRKENRLLNYRFYGAPCVLLLFMENSLTSWSTFDMGLFAQNIAWRPTRLV